MTNVPTVKTEDMRGFVQKNYRNHVRGVVVTNTQLSPVGSIRNLGMAMKSWSEMTPLVTSTNPSTCLSSQKKRWMIESKRCKKKKWKQHFLKYTKQRETPKRKSHQRPILEPRKIGHKIDTRMPRGDWTIYKEQNTNYGESSNTQGQHRMVGQPNPSRIYFKKPEYKDSQTFKFTTSQYTRIIWR